MQRPRTRKTDQRTVHTRAALIEAAIRLIGRHGIDGVTIRQISAEAGVNLAATRYHFGSKAGLYEAVITAVADRISQTGPGRFLHQLTPRDIEAMSAAAARAAASRIMLAAIRPLDDDGSAWDLQRFFQREVTGSGRAAHIFYHARFRHDVDLLARLVARITGDPPDSERARLKALMLIGQSMFLRLAQPLVRLTLDWPGYGEAELPKIADAFWLCDDTDGENEGDG